ncbi:hypothetical protein ACTA71_008419 [Dictyostelium dimigraforme]
MIRLYSLTLNELYFKLETLINKIKSEERLIKLKQEAIEIEDLPKVLSSDYKSQGWQSIQTVNGIHSMYKEHGSGIHSVRIEGIIDQPIFNVCSIIMEVLLINQFLMFVQSLYLDTKIIRIKNFKSR